MDRIYEFAKYEKGFWGCSLAYIEDKMRINRSR